MGTSTHHNALTTAVTVPCAQCMVRFCHYIAAVAHYTGRVHHYGNTAADQV